MQIQQLQSLAQKAYDRDIARRNIYHQMQSRLTVHHQGGVFKIDSNLIVFLNSWTDLKLVLLDEYQSPVEVNRLELLVLAKQRYQEVMNEWLLEWQLQNQIRSADHV